MPIDIVVGSGPSGVAAASALVGRGREVLMLDAGEAMEPANQALRARMAALEPDQWSAADREAAGAVRRAERSDSMRPFGSDFLFRIPAAAGEWGERSAVHELRPSFAKGGLTNGWGGSVLPYRDQDTEDWPVTAAELAPHYRAVSEFAPIAARRDDLAALFPAYPIRQERPLPMSRQAQGLLRRLEHNRAGLARRGVHFGQSRQAVAPGCRQCAMCLYGCPYGLIFNADAAVERLVAQGGLTYRAGVYVLGFEERGGEVRVRTREGEITGDRLFVAGGVLPTTLMALRSLGAQGRAVRLKDSQHFYLPMLHGWGAGKPAEEPRHTLAQLFWEIVDREVDTHTVHVQLYSHNDNYAVDMRQRFGRLADAMGPLIEAMSQRLIVAQAFLHSDASPEIELSLAGGAGSERLDFRRVDNPQTAAAVGRVTRALARTALGAGMAPLTPLVRLGRLGSSFHSGGSLPMRRSPGPLETDVLGRPGGLERVHLVDASVFPSVPATTVTFPVMANAHRIASEAP
jgi:choline dehydrogenase-like flavoprotein